MTVKEMFLKIGGKCCTNLVQWFRTSIRCIRHPVAQQKGVFKNGEYWLQFPVVWRPASYKAITLHPFKSHGWFLTSERLHWSPSDFSAVAIVDLQSQNDDITWPEIFPEVKLLTSSWSHLWDGAQFIFGVSQVLWPGNQKQKQNRGP